MELSRGLPETVGMSAQRIQYLKELSQSLVDKGIASALVVLVARRGTIVLEEVFGKLDPDKDAPPRQDTLFYLGSASSLITIAAAMVLVDDGLLGLNRPVSSYVPEFRGEGKERIMVHHLLAHSSGLRDTEVGYPGPGAATLREENKTVKIPPLDSDQHPEIHEYLHLTYDAPINRAPNTEMSQGHYSIELLGEVIRRVAGKPLPDFARQRIFDPLGMKDTFYVLPESEQYRRVKSPPDPLHGRLVEWFRHNQVPWASFSVWTSPRDMLVFGQMFLDKGRYDDVRVLSHAAVTEMTRDQVPGLSAQYRDEFIPEASWGLGWNVHGKKRALGDGSLQSPSAFYQGNSNGPIVWVDPVYEIVGVYFSTILTRIEDEWPGDLFMNAVTASCEPID